MRQYLLSLLSVFVLLVTSCAPGRGRESQNTPPPPASRLTKADSTPTSPTSVVQITDANYEEIVRSQKVVLILFWAEWSAPDRLMIPVINALSNEYLGRVTIGKVNVDDNPKLTRKFNISGIPTMVVMKDGNEQERVVGVASKKTISELLDKQLSNPE